MNHIKRIFSVLLLSFAFVCMLSAKGVSVPAVYIFGMSFSFNDSTVYFTEIQKIENAWLIDKGKMLEGRSAYAAQLRNYFSSQGQKDQTCIIYYALSEKAILKQFSKVRDRYTNPKKRRKVNYEMRSILRDSFRFQPVEHDTSTDEPVQTKAERKAAKQASRQAAKAAKQAARDRRKSERSGAEKGSAPAKP